MKMGEMSESNSSVLIVSRVLYGTATDLLLNKNKICLIQTYLSGKPFMCISY